LQAGGGGIDMPTTLVEEYGICYVDDDGKVPDSYCGTTSLMKYAGIHCILGVASNRRVLPRQAEDEREMNCVGCVAGLCRH